MILGIGTDIVDVGRIERAVERFGERFIKRIFTDNEASYCKEKKEKAAHLAARFAAKEAVLKAFGTGVDKGIGLLDVEVMRSHGRPEIILHGNGKETAVSLGVKRIHLSISHDAGMALAFVVIDG